MALPRGIRNNNPGNIKISDTKWQGKLNPSSDPIFETFTAPEYGIRALSKIILNDAKEGFNTIHKIISRYAPSTENNTNAYERNVATHLNVNIDDIIDTDDYETMYALVSAIMLYENGQIPYSDAVINKGLNLAGVYNVPPLAKAQQPECQAAVGAGVLGSCTAVGTAVQAVSPAIPLVQDMIHLAPWLISISLACGAVYFGYLVYKRHSTGV